MAGRRPDYRLVIPQDNGRGKTAYFRCGAGWLNENKETGEKSIGLEFNAGLPVVIGPHTKLVLFEQKDEEE